MTIDQAYQLCQFVSNKTQQGNVSPAQFNMLAPIAQISVINKLLGNEQEYTSNNPVPRYGAFISQKVSEYLRPLIVVPTTLPIVYGVMNYPVDALYIFTIQIPGAYQPAERIEFDEAIYLQASQIKPPTAQYPKHYVVANYIYMLPASLTTGNISYIRKPFTPVWNYTIVNNAPVYNPVGSQDFEVSTLLHLRIVTVILQMIGVNLNLDQVTAFASQLEQQGA